MLKQKGNGMWPYQIRQPVISHLAAAFFGERICLHHWENAADDVEIHERNPMVSIGM
jgi:hypothetical protein